MTPAFDPDRTFAALADATRRDIVLRAVAGDEGVLELAQHYPMSFAAVQKHVAVLERAGLVQVDGRGASIGREGSRRSPPWLAARASCRRGNAWRA